VVASNRGALQRVMVLVDQALECADAGNA
jgi:hypothetical protein